MTAVDIAVIGGEGRVDMGERGAILVAGKVSLKADQFAGCGEVETVIFLAFIHETVDILSGASNPAGYRCGVEVGLLCQGLQTCVNLLTYIEAYEDVVTAACPFHVLVGVWSGSSIHLFLFAEKNFGDTPAGLSQVSRISGQCEWGKYPPALAL